jgi:hypothetical protein
MIDEAAKRAFRFSLDLILPLLEKRDWSNDESSSLLLLGWWGPIHADSADHLNGLEEKRHSALAQLLPWAYRPPSEPFQDPYLLYSARSASEIDVQKRWENSHLICQKSALVS